MINTEFYMTSYLKLIKKNIGSVLSLSAMAEESKLTDLKTETLQLLEELQDLSERLDRFI